MIWSRAVRAAQLVLLHTERTPLRGPVHALYLAVARAAGACLTRGETQPAVYVRAGLGTGDFEPGRSDIDLAIVVAAEGTAPGIASGRVWRRWERIARVLPRSGRLLEEPRVYDNLELSDVVGASAMTYGLECHGEDRAVLSDGGASVGMRRILFRPGLYGATSDWRLLSGPDHRPLPAPRGAQERRIAGWLELRYWWRWAFHACANPEDPATAGLCMKLIAEVVRVWLWLSEGERYGPRTEVLQRALHVLPEEEQAIRAALELQSSRRNRGEKALAHALAALLRLSCRIARLIAAEIAGAGVTEVRLVADTCGSVDGTVALCDWRALVDPPRPAESFTLVGCDPTDPEVLGAATRTQSGSSYVALDGPSLLILAAPFGERSRGRALMSEVTDPVAWALAAGASVARFPAARGWSAEDTARRAVAEHRAWLRCSPASRPMWKLLSAARAALFLQSIRRGQPELAPTLRGAGELLAARFPASGVEEAVRSDSPDALRNIVLRLPEYAAVSALKPSFSDSASW